MRNKNQKNRKANQMKPERVKKRKNNLSQQFDNRNGNLENGTNNAKMLK